MMMTIALSFASCGGNDSEDEGDNGSGQTSSSGSIGSAESGNIVKTNDYYITPCLKWGMSMDDIKSKMAGNEYFTFLSEDENSGNKFLMYQLKGNLYCNLMYFEYNGSFYGVQYTCMNSKYDRDELLSAVVADGYKLDNTYTEGEGDCYLYYSPSKKTALVVILTSNSYILQWMNAAYY